MSTPREPRLGAVDLLLLTAIGGGAVSGMAWLVPGTWGATYALQLWLPVWLIACALFGGAALDQRAPWVRRLVRIARLRITEWGGGAYAAIALVVFGWLEWAAFQDTWSVLTALDGKHGVRELIRGSFDFGVQSLVNGIFAFLWPGFWRKAFDAGQMVPAALVAWGVFECARWAIARVATSHAD